MFVGSLDKHKDIITGLKRGIVKDLNDPDKLNRVKVMLIDESLETPFADVMAKFAGETYGSVFVPRQGEEVLVGFLDGNINSPVILGSLYNSKIKPPLEINQENEIMFIQFPSGLKIEINNKEDDQKILITTKAEHIISLEEGSNEQLEVKNKSGNTSFKIDFKNGELEIKAENKISFSAGQDTMILENQKGLNLSTSAGKLEVSANSVSMKASTNFECEASAQFTAKGSAGIEVSSTGQTVLKGSMTQIN